MALAASSVLSTAVIGLMVLGAAALAARSIWKNKKKWRRLRMRLRELPRFVS